MSAEIKSTGSMIAYLYRFAPFGRAIMDISVRELLLVEYTVCPYRELHVSAACTDHTDEAKSMIDSIPPGDPRGLDVG